MRKCFLMVMLVASGFFACFGQATGKQWLDLNYANDGEEYHNLDIYLPGDGSSVYKPIIIIYGSAWFGNNLKKMAYETMGKSLLEAGFAVVSINHRSSADAAYPAQINDVKAAIRYVRANADKYNIDPSFIGITGYSSGGHLAALAGASNGVGEHTVGKTTLNIEGDLGEHVSISSKVHAVVDWFGPIDMSRMDACEKPKGSNSPEAALIKAAPADSPDMVALISPLTFLDKNDPPFLVIHGEADDVVPFCQSELFAEALEKEGLLTDFIPVPEGKHGPITFNDATFKQMTDFFLKEAGR